MGATESFELLENNNIACFIIKGSATMAYPSPIMRVQGDGGILVKRKDYEAAATILESCGYQLIGEKELSHHHLKYVKDGVAFELHRRLATMLESNTELFEEGINNREIREYQGFSFPVLPNDFNGLVLLYHIYQHLRSGLGLRQIVDWVMYLQENEGMERLLPLLRRTNMEKFAKTVTIGCQKYFKLKTLGVDS